MAPVAPTTTKSTPTDASDASYLLHLCPDEEVQLSTETQHLQAHLLRTQLDRHKWSLQM